MNTQIELSVIIPAYNEEKRIVPTILAIHQYLEDNKGTWAMCEIIVVCDGCSDLTEEVAGQLFCKIPYLHVISLPKNYGKGFALKQGIAASRGSFVLCTDADSSTPIEELSRLVRPLRDKTAQIVIGSRRTAEARIKVPQPVYRQIMGRMLSWITQGLLGLPFKDTQCGFKLYLGNIARILFAGSKCPGFAIDVEILFLALRSGLKVLEMGVAWRNDLDSRVRPLRDGWLMLWYTISLWTGKKERILELPVDIKAH